MPGHKGISFLGVEHLDITEIQGADSLYEASGIIAQSEANASELASRMTAMSAASNNAEEMITTLTIDYNKARQAAITQELVEIVSGASAI